MKPHRITATFRGVAACTILVITFLFPRLDRTISSIPGEAGSVRAVPGSPGTQQPAAPALVATPASSSSSSKIFFPIVESLSFHDSDVLLSDKPAFDKCNPPSVEHMQVWWDESPYWSINIYMGGISLACTPFRLTPAWMHTVAQQGWTFIPTWVGLQAPCSRFRYRMNPDPAISYQQGRSEAGEAVAAARNLGLMGDQVIYADIESYSGASSACKAAVASFLQGWVDGLHALMAKAGAYGAACTSYVTDWAALSPPPDFVWLAHWYREHYDPFASVWDAPCLSNNLWANHQRIKQYTGPHIETWGDLPATLDSNVLDGAINAFAGLGADLERTEGLAVPQLRAAHLLSSKQGWALAGNRLLWTDDAGASWREITPQGDNPAPVLAAAFLDGQHGWLVRLAAFNPSADELLVQSTSDGGRSWQSFPLQVGIEPGGAPISQAFVEFVDSETGWLAVRLQSGSSFSLGRLFATRDGGRTWQERSLPLGEPVRFLDAEHGWVAGGPSGDQLFYTADGGRTWRSQAPTLPAGAAPDIYYGLPAFHSGREVVLPVTLAGPDPQLALYTASRPGADWKPAQIIDLADLPAPGSPLPFSSSPQGSWWAAAPGAGSLYSAPGASLGNASRLESGLLQGAIALDFASQVSGWAIVQDGNCVGQKTEAGSGGLQCSSQTRLLRTADGGRTWEEITPAP